MNTSLPPWVLKSPQLFYASAVVMCFGYFAVGIYEVNEAAYQYGSSTAVRLASLRVFLDALREALYLAGTGVWLQVTLAIWSRLIASSVKAAA